MSAVDELTRDSKNDSDGGPDTQLPGSQHPVESDASTHADAAVDAGGKDMDPSGKGDAAQGSDGAVPIRDAEVPATPDSSATAADAGLLPLGAPSANFSCPAAGTYMLCDAFAYPVLVDSSGDPTSPWGFVEPLPWIPSRVNLFALGSNQVVRLTTDGAELSEKARMSLVIPEPLSSLHAEFDFGTTAMLVDDFVDIAEIQQQTAANYPGISLVYADDGFYVAASRDDGTQVLDSLPAQRIAPLTSRWVRVSMDMVFALHGSIVIKLDGETVYSNPDVATSSVGVVKSFFALGVYAPHRVAFTGYYDNVLITTK